MSATPVGSFSEKSAGVAGQEEEEGEEDGGGGGRRL